MPRSVWKGVSLKKSLLKTSRSKTPDESRRIVSRNQVILPNCMNESFFIYTGKRHIKVSVNQSMLGYRFGDFVRTRKFNRTRGIRTKKKLTR